MKTILVPFHDDDLAEAALRTACRVAQADAGYVEGLFVRRPPPIIAGEGITLPGDYIARFTEEGEELSRRARERFARVVDELGLPLADVAAESSEANAGWRELEGLEGQAVGDRGRLFDLIVMGRSSAHAPGDWNAVCESALFESGRPVLLTPAQVLPSFCARILVSWNGGTETARTIALGMPWLLAASEVLVLTVEGGTVPGPGADEVALFLLRAGVRARARTIAPEGASVGEAVLAQADAMEADLIFKGAYTHSRLRQMIFGGATRHIVNSAELPVLLAH